MKDNLTIPANIKIKPRRVSIRKGRWSVDEQLFGRNWKKIQSYVRSRSLLQIRSHAQKYFMMQHKIQKRKKKGKNTAIKSQTIENNVQRQNVGRQKIEYTNKSQPFDRSTFADLEHNQILTPQYQYSTISIVPQAVNYGNSNIYPNIQLFSNPYPQMLIENYNQPTYVTMTNTLPITLPLVSNPLIGCSPYFISRI